MGTPIAHATPLATGVGSTGAHLPTLKELGGGLLGVLGGSGRETRGWGSPLSWVSPPTLCLAGSQEVPLWGGGSSSRNQVLGCSSSSPCPSSLKGQSQCPDGLCSNSPCPPRHVHKYSVSAPHPQLGLGHLGYLPPHLGSPSDSGCS